MIILQKVSLYQYIINLYPYNANPNTSLIARVVVQLFTRPPKSTLVKTDSQSKLLVNF